MKTTDSNKNKKEARNKNKSFSPLAMMTRLEKFWVFSTAVMFLTQKGDKWVTLKLLSFPVFLRLFREMLRQMGLKNVNKLVKEWEWLLYATFLTIMSIYNFGKTRSETGPEMEPELGPDDSPDFNYGPLTHYIDPELFGLTFLERQEVKLIKKLLEKCKNKLCRVEIKTTTDDGSGMFEPA